MKYFEFGKDHGPQPGGSGASPIHQSQLEELKAKGYPFTCKIFEDMGHGGLIGENTERFIEEVDAVHQPSKKEPEVER